MNDTEKDKDAIGRIVAAFAARPDVGPDEIVALYNRLTGEAGTAPAAVVPAAPVAASATGRAPALPVENAVTEDKVFCLCCGRGFKMLKRHLGSEHGMTEAEYRRTFGLPEDMPLVAPSYSRRKAAHAKEAGFGKYDRSIQANDA